MNRDSLINVNIYNKLTVKVKLIQNLNEKFIKYRTHQYNIDHTSFTKEIAIILRNITK